MSDKQEQETPYPTLGSRLKRLREQVKETLAEVAGAVEIDERDLENYENGSYRPSEDILALLISHFSIHEKEADKLWKLAGYDSPQQALNDLDSDLPAMPTIVVVPVDARITYTDLTQVSANKQGLVINFMQESGNGTSGKPLVISRVGMSKELAEELITQIREGLSRSKPKMLPPNATY